MMMIIMIRNTMCKRGTVCEPARAAARAEKAAGRQLYGSNWTSVVRERGGGVGVGLWQVGAVWSNVWCGGAQARARGGRSSSERVQTEQRTGRGGGVWCVCGGVWCVGVAARGVCMWVCVCVCVRVVAIEV